MGEETAIEALHHGATDYVLKQRLSRLGPAVHRAIREIEQGAQRRQAEVELRESEERFLSAFEYAAIGMALVAPEGRWLKVNRALCALTGYSEEELLTKSFQDITHPDDLETDLGYVRQLLSGEIPTYQIEKRYFHKAGQIVWIQLNVSLVRDRQGKPLHLISQIQDITEGKQTEQKLRQSEEYFRTVTENAMDIIAVLDADGMLRYISPSVQHVFGYTAEELVGRNPFELVHPEDLAPTQEAFRAAVATPGGTVRAEFRFRHKDGSWRAEEAVTRNLVHDPGVRGVVLNCRDVTERKQAEERLRLLSGAVESAANAIVITDRQGTIIWVNRAFTLLTGYSLPEVVGQKTSLLKSGLHEEAFYRNLWETVLAGRDWSAEMVNRRKDGTLYTEANTITPMRDERGQITHFIAVKQDVTERIRATEALRESESLYQSLVENTPQHIFRKDAAGRFTFGNGPFCNALGKPLADILGKTDADFCPPELAAKYLQDDLRVLQTGQPFEGEEAFKQAGGESIIVNVLKTPLRDAAGQIVGIQGISWDITERRRTQEALRESEENYRALVELSPDAIFLHREGKFVYANPAALKLLGADQPQQLLGRSVFDIVPPENQRRYPPANPAGCRGWP